MKADHMSMSLTSRGISYMSPDRWQVYATMTPLTRLRIICSLHRNIHPTQLRQPHRRSMLGWREDGHAWGIHQSMRCILERTVPFLRYMLAFTTRSPSVDQLHVRERCHEMQRSRFPPKRSTESVSTGSIASGEGQDWVLHSHVQYWYFDTKSTGTTENYPLTIS